MDALQRTAWPLPAPPSSAGGGEPRSGPSATALPGAPPRLPGRIGGIDMARALAIVGMVMVHLGPADVDVSTAGGWWYETPHGRASILFIVLAGVGVSLLAGDRSPRRMARTRSSLVVRAAVLFPMGLALQALGTRVAVILSYYAVFFLVALALVRWRDRMLLAFALAWSLVGPVLYLAVVMPRPEWFLRTEPGLDDPLGLLRALLVTGYYPTLVWVAPLAWGIWLGRRNLRGRAVRVQMLVGGIGVAAASYATASWLTDVVGAPEARVPSWSWLAVAEPHSQMPLWVVGGTAVATAVLAICMIACDRWPRATWPLVATGQLALTIYVGHILVLAAAPDLLLRLEDVGAAAWSTLRLTVVAVALSTLWRAYLPRGPIEWLLRLPAQALQPRP